ncbi:hypothetical protein ACTFIV_006483 [Dictyostelium citrinum]
MSYQITKITTSELRNGIVKGIKSSGVINTLGVNNINSSNNNNKCNGRRSFSTAPFDGEPSTNTVVTKKARSQIIREKKQAEKIESQQAQMLEDALDKEYDEKLYASHFNDSVRAKYTSQYSGRNLPYIHSTLAMLTNGNAIEEIELESEDNFHYIKDKDGKDIYVRANKNNEEDPLEEEDEDQEAKIQEFGIERGPQVNLDNIKFEFASKEAVLHPDVARLSKPNQKQFIRMVETISRVFSNLDTYLENYREKFTNNELTYFEAALKILRTEYLNNPEFRKSFAKDQANEVAALDDAANATASNATAANASSSTPIGLSSKEVQQANKDVEILLTNLLKDLHTKKMKAGINAEIKRTMKGVVFTPEERELFHEALHEENPDATHSLTTMEELDDEIDEIGLEVFEDDRLERGRYLEFDMMAYLKQIGSTHSTLYQHLKSLTNVQERQVIIKEFAQFKNLRDSIRDQGFLTSKESSQSLNDLVISHMKFMNTSESIIKKVSELESIITPVEMAKTKLNLVEAIKLNTTLSPDQLFNKYILPQLSDQQIEELFDENETDENEISNENKKNNNSNENNNNEGEDVLSQDELEAEKELYNIEIEKPNNSQDPNKVLNQLKQELENNSKDINDEDEVNEESIIELPPISELATSPELSGYLEELYHNLGQADYPMYEQHRSYLLRELERLNVDRDIKVNAWEFGTLTEELKQLLIKNGAAFEDLGNRFNQLTTNMVNSPLAAKYVPLPKEALVEKEEQLDNLKQLLEARIKSNYTLKKSQEAEQMIRLREGIQMFREMGLDTDMELIENIIFKNGELDAPRVESIRESDIFEPVQLIKSLYKLGPHKFEDAVESFKRLPSMVYYCQYINDRFLNPKDTYIAQMDLDETDNEKFPPRLRYGNHSSLTLENSRVPVLSIQDHETTKKSLLKDFKDDGKNIEIKPEVLGIQPVVEAEEGEEFEFAEQQGFEEENSEEQESTEKENTEEQEITEDQEDDDITEEGNSFLENTKKKMTPEAPEGMSPEEWESLKHLDMLDYLNENNKNFVKDGGINNISQYYQDPLQILHDGNLIPSDDVQLFDKKLNQIISVRETTDIIARSEARTTNPNDYINYHPKVKGEMITEQDEKLIQELDERYNELNEEEIITEEDLKNFEQIETYIHDKYLLELGFDKEKLREEFIDQVHLNKVNQMLNSKEYNDSFINLDEMIKESIIKQRRQQQQQQQLPPLSPQALEELKNSLRKEFESLQKDIEEIMFEAQNINELSKAMETLKKSEIAQAEKAKNEADKEDEDEDEDEDEEYTNDRFDQEEYDEEEYDKPELEEKQELQQLEQPPKELEQQSPPEEGETEIDQFEYMSEKGIKESFKAEDALILDDRAKEWFDAELAGEVSGELNKLEDNILNPDELKFPELLRDPLPKLKKIKDPKSVFAMSEENIQELDDSWKDDVSLELPSCSEDISSDPIMADFDQLMKEDEKNDEDDKLIVKGTTSQEVDQDLDQDIDLILNRDNHPAKEDVDEVTESSQTTSNTVNDAIRLEAMKNPIISISEDQSALEQTETVSFTLKGQSEYDMATRQYQLHRIQESFPNFGISDDSQFSVEELIYDEDGDADFADKLFMLEVNSLLTKGNILDQETKPIFEDQYGSEEVDKIGPDEKLAEEMGYEREEIDDEDESEETENQDEEEENEGDDDAFASNANEFEAQLKDDEIWRDIPNLDMSNIVDISRHIKVTKAGRVQSYSVTVFKGDGNGTAGMGYGKGDSPSSALKRAMRDAERNAFTLDRFNDLTLPSGLDMKYRSTKIKFFKSRAMGDMDYRGIKPSLVLPTIGLHGVTFRTYGKKDWNSVLLTLQKCLPHYTNPEEAARIMGKKFVTPNKENSKKKTLHQLLKSKLESRNNDPYNLGMVSKFLFDVEDKPDINDIKERRYKQEIDELFQRYPITPTTSHLYNNDYEEFKFNNNSSTKRIDKMHQRGRKHERNTKDL